MKPSGFMAPAESVARAVTKALNRTAGATTTMQKIIEQREAAGSSSA